MPNVGKSGLFHGRVMPVGGVVLLVGILFQVGCANVPRSSTERNDLSAMRMVSVEIKDRTSFKAYVADTEAARLLGLMNVTEGELPADYGMIFVFSYDQYQSFWMRNVVIPVDIAYIRSDGTIVKIYTMEPLNESGYPSIEPARFVLEVGGGEFARWGIREGDHVEIPAELFD